MRASAKHAAESAMSPQEACPMNLLLAAKFVTCMTGADSARVGASSWLSLLVQACIMMLDSLDFPFLCYTAWRYR